MEIKNEQERLHALQASEFKRNPFWLNHVLPYMGEMRANADKNMLIAVLASDLNKAHSYAATIEAIDALLATIEYPIEVFASLTNQALEESTNG
jgi:hypothetical protein